MGEASTLLRSLKDYNYANILGPQLISVSSEDGKKRTKVTQPADFLLEMRRMRPSKRNRKPVERVLISLEGPDHRAHGLLSLR